VTSLRGAVAGALVGLLVTWLFAVFNWFDPRVAWGWLIFDGLWFGLVVGAILGVLLHAVTAGRRDFASVPAMVAERYELLVDDDVADEAARLLATLDGAAASAEPATARDAETSEPRA
jgi:hypothetical protein